MARAGWRGVTTIGLTSIALVGLVAAPSPSVGDVSAPASTAISAASGSPMRGQIRLDQLGHTPRETKTARLMSPRRIGPAASPTTYAVEDGRGNVVLRGDVPTTPVGSWNDRYRAVYRLDLTALHRSGRYRVTTAGAVAATSPWFRIQSPGALFGTILDAGVAFDQSQRDGEHVIAGLLHRRPSHLLDRRSTVYRWPRMQRGSDLILDQDLHPLPGATQGPVDVEGGWADAGDYLKFTHTAAYNDVVLFTSAELLGHRAPPALLAEARYGERWLERMWRPAAGTLLIQVGIGSGNRAGTFLGDHDLWRLPEADDRNPDPAARYVSHRPVFAASAGASRPGKGISPNLVGRVSAAFAQAARADAAERPGRAARELGEAEQLYATAATVHPPHLLVTALPHAFYPESSWTDDLALGAAQIALAAHRLGLPAQHYLRDSAHWARAYLDSHSTDTLNLYDTGALTDLALTHALRTIPHGPVEVSPASLLANLRHQIGLGRAHAATDPFAASVSVDEFDVNSHTFGLIATVGIYDALTGSGRYQGFATAQRTWLLGGDPWGVSAMVGVGDVFPICMQHQVANLSGGRHGTPPLDVGAVVNGPNGAGNFSGGLGGFQDGMVPCTAASRRLDRFDGQGSRYVDDVRAWQTDEPALDMTGAAILAAAAQLHLYPHARLHHRTRDVR